MRICRYKITTEDINANYLYDIYKLCFKRVEDRKLIVTLNRWTDFTDHVAAFITHMELDRDGLDIEFKTLGTHSGNLLESYITEYGNKLRLIPQCYIQKVDEGSDGVVVSVSGFYVSVNGVFNSVAENVDCIEEAIKKVLVDIDKK